MFEKDNMLSLISTGSKTNIKMIIETPKSIFYLKMCKYSFSENSDDDELICFIISFFTEVFHMFDSNGNATKVYHNINYYD